MKEIAFFLTTQIDYHGDLLAGDDPASWRMEGHVNLQNEHHTAFNVFLQRTAIPVVKIVSSVAKFAIGPGPTFEVLSLGRRTLYMTFMKGECGWRWLGRSADTLPHGSTIREMKELGWVFRDARAMGT